MSFTIKKIDHVVIAVQDLAAAKQTYQSLYGLQVEAEGDAPALGISNVVFKVGDGSLELAAPLGDDPRNLVRRRLEDGEGLFMLSLEVDDLDAAVADLRAQGATATDPSSGPSRLSFISPKNAHGVRLQLIQRGR